MFQDRSVESPSARLVLYHHPPAEARWMAGPEQALEAGLMKGSKQAVKAGTGLDAARLWESGKQSVVQCRNYKITIHFVNPSTSLPLTRVARSEQAG